MLNIPEDKLPQEFKDEARLTSLFSPFRSRTVNPKDWDTKIASWKHLIYLYCINNYVYSFTFNVLNKAFIRNGRPPSCLSVVVEELVKSGELEYSEQFLKKNQNWGGWATDLIKKPISWSLSTIRKSLFVPSQDKEQVYVHVEVIKQESLNLIKKIPHKNKLISLNQVLEILDKDVSHVDDIKLLVHYLAKNQKAEVTILQQNVKEVDKFLIKFAENDAVTPISEVEIGVYVLEQNEKLFTKHVEDLEDEISNCIKEVKVHLLKGHKQLAKTILRKKHEVEKRLERKINALHNIQVLLEKIRDVHTDADVWKSYKHALAAFNTTFTETGLNEDAVEDTMLKLGEVFIFELLEKYRF